MRLLDPRDLFLLFVMALVKGASWLPTPGMREGLARLMGRAGYYFDRSIRLHVERNIRRAFDGRLSDEEVRRIVMQSLCEYWVEPLSLLPSKTELRRMQQARVQGIEHLHRALADGKGVIIWESSFGRRILPKRVFSQMGFALHQIHADHHFGEFFGGYGSQTWVRQRILRPFFDRCEQQFATEIIYLPDSGSLAFARLLMRRLRENAILVSTADGLSGERFVALDFLQQPALFATGMVSLARASGAPILPLFCVPGESAADVIIEPPILVQSGDSREQAPENCLSRYARLLESYIRKYPEKYRGWAAVGRSRELVARRRQALEAKRKTSSDSRYS